jgi:hypothetical protein
MAAPELDVDSVIEKLLEVRGSRPGKQVNLTENDVKVQVSVLFQIRNFDNCSCIVLDLTNA